MIELSHIALTRWGKWFASSSVGGGGSGLAFNYNQRSIQSTNPDYDDPIAVIVDSALASLPDELIQVDFALKLKYGFGHSNYEASLKMHIGQTTYKEFVNKGQLWTYCVLVTLKNYACPPKLKEFIDETAEIERRRKVQKKGI